MQFLDDKIQEIINNPMCDIAFKVQSINNWIEQQEYNMRNILKNNYTIVHPWSDIYIKEIEKEKITLDEPTSPPMTIDKLGRPVPVFHEILDGAYPYPVNNHEEIKKNIIKKVNRLFWIFFFLIPVIGGGIISLACSTAESKDKKGRPTGGILSGVIIFIIIFSLSLFALIYGNRLLQIIGGTFLFGLFIGLFISLFNAKKELNDYADRRAHAIGNPIYLEEIKKWEKVTLTEKVNKNIELLTQASQEMRNLYFKKNPYTISMYISEVLMQNHKAIDFLSPDTEDILYDQDIDVEFLEDTEIAVIDIMYPAPSDMPNVKEIRYIKTKSEIRKIPMTQKQINELYDDFVYQLCLSDINQIFLMDEINVVDSVIYNAWVETIDKSNGQLVKTCILSIQVSKEKFSKINLKQVDAKECFRSLKGIGSSQAHSITPIAPIARISRADERFIESYDVAHTLDDSVNLAAMDWQDFEHLVREIFSKYLSTDGVEVKVTQSSQDKGVDAIAIDPDPIRGGKIVIQAKRYTNVVGVSAVRDLYGTVMNEGAMKGILVTTSYFGSDSYDFIKGKPLTLISGGELLGILNKNGYNANINLKEAKKILNQKERNLRLIDTSE